MPNFDSTPQDTDNNLHLNCFVYGSTCRELACQVSMGQATEMVHKRISYPSTNVTGRSGRYKAICLASMASSVGVAVTRVGPGGAVVAALLATGGLLDKCLELAALLRALHAVREGTWDCCPLLSLGHHFDTKYFGDHSVSARTME